MLQFIATTFGNDFSEPVHSRAIWRNAALNRQAVVRRLLVRFQDSLSIFVTASLRTGSVVIALPQEGAAVAPYLVLTLWPRMQKPRPTAVQMPIDNVKCFRAVKLLRGENDATDTVLTPTNEVELLASHNVLALLDSSSDDVNSGEIKVTVESLEVLKQMQSDDFIAPEMPKQRRGAIRVKKTVLKAGGEAVKKMMMKKKAKTAQAGGEKVATKAAVPKPSKKKDSSAIMEKADAITAQDLRRSTQGRKAICTVVERFRVQDALKFPADPVFDPRTDIKCSKMVHQQEQN